MAWARCYGCNPEHDLLLTASQAAAAATAAAAELQSLVEAGFDLFLVVQFMSEGEAEAAEQRRGSGGDCDVGKNKRRTVGTCNSLSRGPMGYACVQTYEYEYKYFIYALYMCIKYLCCFGLAECQHARAEDTQIPKRFQMPPGGPQ